MPHISSSTTPNAPDPSVVACIITSCLPEMDAYSWG
ncbi:Uncharacterised protein [Vibrio cholerae]|nr:Uncharacterised protein [Vibrio cholerae]